MKQCDLCKSEVDELFTLDGKYRIYNSIKKMWTKDICSDCKKRITHLEESANKMIAITLQKLVNETRRNWVKNLVIKIFNEHND